MSGENLNGKTEEGQKPLTDQELAAESAQAQVEDHEIDGEGSPQYNEKSGRYVDPNTGRFAKRPEAPRLERIDDPRERIAAAFAKARKESEDENEAGPKLTLPKQLRTGMTDEEVEEQIRLQQEDEARAGGGDEGAEQEPEPGPKDQPQNKPGEPVPLSIVVDGKMFYVDRNDPRWAPPGADDATVRNIAQMYWAAQNRLSTANQLLDESKGHVSKRPADHAGPELETQPPQQGAADQGETKPVIDRNKLGDIADRVQLGNRDELVEALEELVASTIAAVGNRQQQPVNIQDQVDQAFVQRDNQNEIDRAISKFETDHSDIAGNKYLSTTVLDIAVDLMVDDMKKLGVTDEMLKPVLGKGKMIAGMYRNMRAQGYPLHTHGEVLDRAAENLRQTFNLPRSQKQSQADAATAQQRVAQKRQMQTQPRSSGVRNNQGQPPRPMTRQDIIRQEKARRMPWLS